MRNSSAFSLFLAFFLFCGITLTFTIPTRDVHYQHDFDKLAHVGRSTLQSLPPRGLLYQRDVTPPVPSIDDCKAQLNVPRDQAVFYSSKVMESATAWANANGGVTVWMAGLTAYQNTLVQQIKDARDAGKDTWDLAERDAFFVACSKAFAQLSSGEITAILPAGKDGNVELPEGSFFTLYEWPILKDSSQNAGVTQVTGIVGNEQGNAPTGVGKVIFPC